MLPEPKALSAFHRALQAWYRRHGRHDLPWRQTRDPYAIWISEVMLQQTQVKTVRERYYFPFLERFPTISALAAADLQEVLKCWEGLGYYNRARHLHRTARALQAQGGTLPRAIPDLMALPGIGRNTAHALAAFAWRQAVPVMEANLKRVLARIYALENPTEAQLWERAAATLNARAPFDYNQAMMDLGAMVCTPVAPQCPKCPARGLCAGRGNPTAYPQKKSKPVLPLRQSSICLFTLPDSRIFISPRKGDFLHGLWQFPEVWVEKKHVTFLGTKYTIAAQEYLGTVNHSYSHFKIISDIYKKNINLKINNDEHWKTTAEIAALPLSRTEKKILRLIASAAFALKQKNALLGK